MKTKALSWYLVLIFAIAFALWNHGQALIPRVQKTRAQEELTLTITNSTNVDICEIRAAETGGLGSIGNILDHILRPGESLTISDFPPITVDLIAYDCANEAVDVAFEMALESGAYSWEIVRVEPVLQPLPDPPPTAPDQTWLVMLYIDGDDEPLEQALVTTVNEAELVGSSDQVHVVAQVDRFAGGFAGDGDWSTTKRFYITQDNDLDTVNSEELMDLGETNMSDGNTLVEFATWAIESYPADKYVLILLNHGAGWPGGWTDQSAPDDMLTLDELDDALAQIQDETQLEQFELFGFDACLMSSLEVYTAISPYVRYAVASEEVGRSLMWAYAGFLNDLVNNPGMSGSDLAQSIVEHYIDDDILAAYLSENLLDNIRREMTIAAVDLAALPHLLAALDDVAIEASEIDQETVALARYYSQSYFSIFGKNVPPSYLDLGHFTQMLALEGHSRTLFQSSQTLLAVLDQAIVAEKHGLSRPGSTGITLYFPNSLLYGAPTLPGSRTYTATAERFARDSLWDDFLLAHYTGASMPGPGTGSVAFAAENATITGPGVGAIEVAPINASAEAFSMEQPVFLSTEITGGHVAQIQFFSAYYDEEASSMRILETTLLSAEEDKEVHGVIYPNWVGQTVDGVLSVGGDLWPETLVITDGTNAARALLLPDGYGRTHAAFGTHVSAATGERRLGRVRFDIDTAAMIDVYVFTEERGILVPYEITPQPGDQFIFENIWVDTETGKSSTTDGDSLTFGDAPFWLDTVPLAAGQYLIGITVVDLDGNAYRQSLWLTVEETE